MLGYVDTNTTYENLFTAIYSSPAAVNAFRILMDGYVCVLNKQGIAYKVSGTNFFTTPPEAAKTALISCGSHSSEQMEALGKRSSYAANTRNKQSPYLPFCKK